jgi:hypothetical protein
MLLELYILYSIIAFVGFFIALYFNKGIINIFIWPVSILCFSMLSFASYNIIASYTTNIDNSLFFFNLGMAILSFILFGWDLYDKFKSGDFA